MPNTRSLSRPALASGLLVFTALCSVHQHFGTVSPARDHNAQRDTESTVHSLALALQELPARQRRDVTMEQLVSRLPTRFGRNRRPLLDPWGNPFELLDAKAAVSGRTEISSNGPDGESGTEDDIFCAVD